MTKKAFSYIRMSTAIQLQGDSKRRQIEKSRKYAEKHGYELIDSLEDIGISAFDGKNVEEGELGIFLTALKSGKIDPTDTILLVESFDRLSRENPYKAFSLLSSILETGITVITLIDEQVYTSDKLGEDNGKIFIALGAMLRANEESATKSKRLSSSWEQKRRDISKKKLTSKGPAWLKLNNDCTRFEGENDQAADTVRKIFDLCIDEGLGTYAIARYLNENPNLYPRFTKPRVKNRLDDDQSMTGWHKSYITKILKNPAVHGFFQPGKMVDGKRVPDGKPIDDYYPTIISKERFLLAQSRMVDRRIKGSGRKGEGYSNLFTNIATCGNCGGSIGYKNKKGNKSKGSFLRCLNSDMRYQCSAPNWQYEQFEDAFLEFINEVNLNDALTDKQNQSKAKSLREQRDIVKQKCSAKEDERNNLLDRIGKVDDEIFDLVNQNLKKVSSEVTALTDEIREIGKQISELESVDFKKSQDELIATFKQSTDVSDLKEKGALRRKLAALIRSIVSKVVVNNMDRLEGPWEALDAVPVQLISELHDEGRFSAIPEDIESLSPTEQQKLSKSFRDDLEIYFSSEYGQRRYNEAVRTFTVHFKSGGLKVVHPYKNQAYRLVQDPRLAKVIQRAKDNQSKQ